jgi:hypothetical protein
VARPFPQFVSYSTKNDVQVRAIVAIKGRALDHAFLDWRRLHIGDNFEHEIFSAIDGCDEFHLCWSMQAATSRWVQRELDRALARWESTGRASGFLFVYRLDDHPLPASISDHVHVVSVVDLAGPLHRSASDAPPIIRTRPRDKFEPDVKRLQLAASYLAVVLAGVHILAVAWLVDGPMLSSHMLIAGSLSLANCAGAYIGSGEAIFIRRAVKLDQMVATLGAIAHVASTFIRYGACTYALLEPQSTQRLALALALLGGAELLHAASWMPGQHYRSLPPNDGATDNEVQAVREFFNMPHSVRALGTAASAFCGAVVIGIAPPGVFLAATAGASIYTLGLLGNEAALLTWRRRRNATAGWH